MNIDDRNRRLQELFALGVDLPPSEQAEFCHRHCADDPTLRIDLEELLGVDRTADDSFLANPVVATPATPSAVDGADSVAVSFADPTSIGPYRILERIGEGGMGVVYVADQTEPVRRKVAVKVIKPGMDSRRVIARFEAERQALALMNHSSIARIYDGGTTVEGGPFFAMELVTGLPIDRFCKQKRLSTRARLELFASVCDAVQHAHQKGILHRDLKPSNILVHEQDGEVRPKIIDFGIARATTQPLTPHTLHTMAGEMVGTLHYMSPEQADRQGSDVDSRTDIYSLGVLLYELLTEQLPFDPGAFSSTPAHEMSRILREWEPVRPSSRIADVATAREVAAHHGTDARTLRRTLRGELDWITMKALEKDRERRYATSSELAADVRRYLDFEPVLAGAPSAWYRLRKLARRHRGTAAAIVAFALALVVGIVVATWGLIQASEAASRAETARARAQDMTDVLLDTLGFANPDISNDPNATMGDLVDRLLPRLEGKYPDAATEVRFRTGFGVAYWSRGKLDAAIEQFGKALAISSSRHGVSPFELHELRWTYAWAAYMADDAETAPAWLQVATSGIDLVAERSPELATMLQRARYRMPQATERTTDAIAALGEIVRLAERTLPIGDPRWQALADVLCVCADPYCYSDKYQPDTGVAYLRQALEIYRDRAGMVETNSRFGLVNELLVQALFWGQHYQEGAELADRTRTALARSLPEGHWYPSLFQALLGAHQGRFGDAHAAMANLEAGLSRLPSATGSLFGSTVHLLLVGELVALRQKSGAEAAAERWSIVLCDLLVVRGGPIERIEQILRPKFGDVVDSLQRLENLTSDAESARPLIAELLQASRERMTGDPHLRAVAVGWLMRCVRQLANHLCDRADTEQLAHDVAIPALEALFGLEPSTRQTQFTSGYWLICTLLHCGDAVRARDVARRWRDMLSSPGFVSFQRTIAQAMAGWAELHAAANEAERTQAIQNLRGGYDGMRFAALEPDTDVIFRRLMNSYQQVGRDAEGVPLARERMQILLLSDAGAIWLNTASWCLARLPGLETSDYELALAGIREAVRVDPGRWAFENTLGAALYRAGQDREAVEVLVRATALRRDAGRAPSPNDLVFLVMAHCRTGDRDAAAQAMAQLDASMKAPGRAEDLELEALVREAQLAFDGR